MAKLEELKRKAEALMPGTGACPGCGTTLAITHIAEVIVGELGKKLVLVIPASCWTINTGKWPSYTGHGTVTTYLALFSSAAPEAAGIADACALKGYTDTVVMPVCGDGATFDIGFGDVSAAAERNDNILYVVRDNEAYMNTGIQKSGATPFGAYTTTTPHAARHTGKKKDIDQIMASHDIPYLATAALGSVALLKDFREKVKKAAQKTGFRFLHILDPCPPGWKFTADKTVEIARLAVASRVFPILEYENGIWRITHRPKKPASVKEYLSLQGRFANMTDAEIQEVERQTNERYAMFERLCQKSS